MKRARNKLLLADFILVCFAAESSVEQPSERGFKPRENYVLKWECINQHCIIVFSVKLMLNLSKYFRKRSDSRQLCCVALV